MLAMGRVPGWRPDRSQRGEELVVLVVGDSVLVIHAGGRQLRCTVPELCMFLALPSGTSVAPSGPVQWPVQALELQRRFAPRSCPGFDCPEHARRASRGFSFRHEGY